MKNSVFCFLLGLIFTATAVAQELPSVSVVASDALATEPPGVVNFVDTGVFTISRQGPTNYPLMVFFTLGGTASNSVDYLKIESPVTIPAGARSTRVTVVPLPDDLVEGDERVLLRIVGSPIVGPGSGYILPTNSLGAVVTIRDYHQEPTNSPPSVNIVRPGNGASFIPPANVTIAAQTVDPDGWVP
ncbi:MAG TPA: hypothetical protein VJ063_02670, partial [Verrucomicrobiae bacterium]|nr:hypothetical protein [Verrucomicrobiae bacterium]